jgi:hypothetical protein
MADHPPGPREPGETAARDQKQAELRDLLRLHALMEPYAPDGSTDIKDILPVMPATDRAEAEGILDRIACSPRNASAPSPASATSSRPSGSWRSGASRSSATDSRSPTPAPARYSKIRRPGQGAGRARGAPPGPRADHGPASRARRQLATSARVTRSARARHSTPPPHRRHAKPGNWPLPCPRRRPRAPGGIMAP